MGSVFIASTACTASLPALPALHYPDAWRERLSVSGAWAAALTLGSLLKSIVMCMSGRMSGRDDGDVTPAQEGPSAPKGATAYPAHLAHRALTARGLALISRRERFMG